MKLNSRNKILMILDKELFMDVKQIAKILELDESTVQRQVKKLHDEKIIFRYQKNDPRGGFIFYYRLK